MPRPKTTHSACIEQSPSVVGDTDGTAVGPALGLAVGNSVGDAVGASVGAAVSHRSLSMQMPLAQSRSRAHFLPSAHGAHNGPPQSTDVSPWLSTSSTQNAHVGETVGDTVGANVRGSVDPEGHARSAGHASFSAGVGQ